MVAFPTHRRPRSGIPAGNTLTEIKHNFERERDKAFESHCVPSIQSARTNSQTVLFGTVLLPELMLTLSAHGGENRRNLARLTGATSTSLAHVPAPVPPSDDDSNLSATFTLQPPASHVPSAVSASPH